MTFFGILEQATLATEGICDGLEKTLPMMDFILNLLDEAKVEHIDDPVLFPAIQAGWKKLSKYYDNTSKSPAYAAAVVLDPSLKWEYFEDAWVPEWMPPARAAVQELWEREYAPKFVPEVDPNLQDITPLPRLYANRSTPHNLFNQFLSKKRAPKWVPQFWLLPHPFWPNIF
jgi:hypothetical protein